MLSALRGRMSSAKALRSVCPLANSLGCPMRNGSAFGCCCLLIRRGEGGGPITGR